jgi:hypothetical protein
MFMCVVNLKAVNKLDLTWKQSFLIVLHLGRLQPYPQTQERLAKDKHSSLLRKFVNYRQKSFITLAPDEPHRNFAPEIKLLQGDGRGGRGTTSSSSTSVIEQFASYKSSLLPKI